MIAKSERVALYERAGVKNEKLPACSFFFRFLLFFSFSSTPFFSVLVSKRLKLSHERARPSLSLSLSLAHRLIKAWKKKTGYTSLFHPLWRIILKISLFFLPLFYRNRSCRKKKDKIYLFSDARMYIYWMVRKQDTTRHSYSSSSSTNRHQHWHI